MTQKVLIHHKAKQNNQPTNQPTNPSLYFCSVRVLSMGWVDLFVRIKCSPVWNNWKDKFWSHPYYLLIAKGENRWIHAFGKSNLVSRVFTKCLRDQDSIPDQIIPKTYQKTQKMVLDTFLLNTQHYKVHIKENNEIRYISRGVNKIRGVIQGKE